MDRVAAVGFFDFSEHGGADIDDPDILSAIEGEEPFGVASHDFVVVGVRGSVAKFVGVFVGFDFSGGVGFIESGVFGDGVGVLGKSTSAGVGRWGEEDDFGTTGQDFFDERLHAHLVGGEAFFVERVVDGVVDSVASDHKIGFRFGEFGIDAVENAGASAWVIGFAEVGGGFAVATVIDDAGRVCGIFFG